MTKVKKIPVIVVLGHVDHGKTSLLDKIRRTSLAAREVGQITQSIGAWQVEVNKQPVTFIDTPGHAAFTQMRSRGAQVADVAVLVVAADDSVKPQTKEAIRIIKQAKIPFVVAATKIDLSSADLEKVKADLARENVIVEDYGGQVVMVPVSNKTGQGIDELLEMILLTYEMNPVMVEASAPPEGFILETQFNQRQGLLVSVIVNQGQLKVNDIIATPTVAGKVKALFDSWGKKVSKVTPGQPALIWGFSQVPEVGEVFTPATTGRVKDKTKKDYIKLRSQIAESLGEAKETKTIPIFLKAPTEGALEAVVNSLPAEVKVIYQGVGEVTESEISLAGAFGIEIVAFQIKVKPAIKSLAESEGVKISQYQIIYKLLEDFEQRVLKLIEPTIDQQVLGRAKVLKVFDIKGQRIAGCQVVKGAFKVGDNLEVLRGDKIIATTQLVSLRIGPQPVDQVKAGSECGMALKDGLDIRENDVIISYKK